MPDKPLNPTAWLWLQLDALLLPETIADLRTGFAAQSKRYSRALTIRLTQREIAQFEHIIDLYGDHSEQAGRYRDRLERRREKLARLEAEAASDES